MQFVFSFTNLKAASRTLAVFIALFAVQAVVATHASATNARLSYQGRILRPDGTPLEGIYRMTIKIFSPAPSACLLWGEQADVYFSKGVFSVNIGDPLQRLTGANAGGASNFTKVFANEPSLASEFVSLSCEDGSTYTPGYLDERNLQVTIVDEGVTVSAYNGPVASAPFALHANNATQVGGYAANNIMKVNPSGPHKATRIFSTAGADFLWELAQSTTVDMGGKRLQNLAAPQSANDAVTRDYVDTALGSIAISTAPQAQNSVYAAPTGSSGLPTFRTLESSDIPLLDSSKIPSLDASKIGSGTLDVDRGGTGLSAFTPHAILAANGFGTALTQFTCATGEVLVWQVSGGFACESKIAGAGTVTSVGLGVPASLFHVTGGPVTTSGTLQVTLASQSAATIFAAPTGAAGSPSFRALAGTDLPIAAGSGVSVTQSGGTLEISATGLGGTVRNISAGLGLLGGTITDSGTLAVDVGVTDGKIVQVGADDKISDSLIPLQAGSGIAILHSGGSISISSTLAGGTVTNVGFAASSLFNIVGGPVTSAGTFNLDLASQTAGLVLASPTGASGIPSFRTLAGTDLPIAAGTGVSVTESGGTLYIGADVGLTDGKIVQVGAGDKIPAALIPTLNLSTLTGTLGVSQGGTGLNASSAIDGQLLIGNGSGFSLNTLTAGSGIAIVNSAGSISISSTLAGGTITEVTAGPGLLGGSIVTAGTLSVDTGVTDGQIVAVGAGDKIAASLIPNHSTDLLTSGTLGNARGGTGLDTSSATNGQLLIGNGAGFSLSTLSAGSGIAIANNSGSISISSTLAGGTVTNVGFTAPASLFSVSNSPVSTSGTIDLNLVSQSAGFVLAAPTGAAGAPSFRAIEASDIFSKFSAGSGISITNTAGSIAISSTLAGGTVTNVTAGTGLLGGNIATTGTLSVDVGLTEGQIVAVGAGDKIAASLLPDHSTDLLTSGTLGTSRGGTGLNASVAANGQVLIGNGAGFSLNTLSAGSGIAITNASGSISISSTLAGGTVTNIGLTASPIFSVSNSPISSSGTLDLSLVSQSAGFILAAPTGVAGTPSFRAITAFDIPSLDASKVGSGLLPASRGGTGLAPGVGNGNQLYGVDSSGSVVEFKTLVAGSGISISNTAGSISINSTLAGGTVTNVTAGSGLLGGNISSSGTLAVDTGVTDGKIVAVGAGDKIAASLLPNHSADLLTSGTLGAARGGTGLDASSASNGQLLIGTGSGFALNTLSAGSGISITNSAGSISINSTLAGGTVTNIGLTASPIFSVSNSPISTFGTISLSLASQNAALVLASPTGSAGVPTFRGLAATDIPAMDASKIGSGVLGPDRGGIGVDASGATNGQLLIGSGSGFALNTLTAGSGISISNSAGSISISSTLAGGTVTSVVAATGLVGGSITSSGTLAVDVGLTDGKIVAVGAGDKIPVALIPSLSTDLLTSGTLGTARGGTGLVPGAGNANQLYGVNNSGSAAEFKTLTAGSGISIVNTAGSISISSTLAGGTVTNIGFTAPASIFTVSNSPVNSSGTIDMALASQSAGFILAAPTGAAGVPSFRAITAFDIPSLDAAKIGSGILAANRGGTGLDNSAAANGQLLIGNGAGFSLATLTAGTGLAISNSSGSINLSIASGLATQWTSVAGGIHYSSGSVGVGDAAPSAKLSVRADNAVATTEVLHVRDFSGAVKMSVNASGEVNADTFLSTVAGRGFVLNGAGARMSLRSDGAIGFNSGTNAVVGTFDTGIARSAAGVLEVNNGTAGALAGFTAGRMSIGTSNLSVGLDIATTGAASALRIPRDSTASRPTGLVGMMRYNTTTEKYEVYDTGGWLSLNTQWDDSTNGVSYAGGSVAVGLPNPSARVHVSGQIVSTPFDNSASTTFNMNNGNTQYTTANCGAMTLDNMVDGGSYTIIVRGVTSGICSFTDSAGGRTFKFVPGNAATLSNSHTIYSMQVAGAFVYVSWQTGY